MTNLTVNTETKVVTINRIFPTGKSAYELAVDYGFVGTEEDWVELQQALADQAAASASTATAQATISTTKASESAASAAAALASQNAAAATLSSKVTLQTSATYSAIGSSTEKRFIQVTTDETNGNETTLYYHNGTNLNWVITQQI